MWFEKIEQFSSRDIYSTEAQKKHEAKLRKSKGPIKKRQRKCDYNWDSHKFNDHLYDVHCNPLLYMLEKWNTEQENFKLHKPL